MTTLEVKLDLPDRLAREALAAGLLTPKALRQMVKDAMRRRAAKAKRQTTQLLDTFIESEKLKQRVNAQPRAHEV